MILPTLPLHYSRRITMVDPKLRPGTKHCKCAACGEYFTVVGNFDLHRKDGPKSRVCVDQSTLVNKKGKARLRRNAQGLWTGVGGIYKPQKA